MSDEKIIPALVTGGKANAGPPLGPALGPMGVNIMEVINGINDKTKDSEKGAPIPVVITAYKNKTFKFFTC